MKKLSIWQTGAMLRNKKLTERELASYCKDHINQYEDRQAWVECQSVEQRLVELENMSARQHWQGPLHGIPIGVKDIIDVAGYPTRCGMLKDAPTTIKTTDAHCVDVLRKLGAVILGKTTTTEYAWKHPSPCRNAYDSSLSPGISSSGSAVAVALGMCWAALGTQIGGSIIRPAVYNGVVGFKPSYGRLNMNGINALCWSFDHLGWITRNTEDAWFMWHALAPSAELDWQPTMGKLPHLTVPIKPTKVWRMRGMFQEKAHPAALNNLDEVSTKLTQQGVTIVEHPLPKIFEAALDAHYTIIATEAALEHSQYFRSHRAAFSAEFAKLIEDGLKVKAVDYILATHLREEVRYELSEILDTVDLAILPASDDVPPPLNNPGSAAFNSLFSFCGNPVIGIPTSHTANGLPLGVQLVGKRNADEDLLRQAMWFEDIAGDSITSRLA